MHIYIYIYMYLKNIFSLISKSSSMKKITKNEFLFSCVALTSSQRFETSTSWAGPNRLMVLIVIGRLGGLAPLWSKMMLLCLIPWSGCLERVIHAFFASLIFSFVFFFLWFFFPILSYYPSPRYANVTVPKNCIGSVRKCVYSECAVVF